MTTSLFFFAWLGGDELDSFVGLCFACLICVGGRGRFSVHRNYCGGKARQQRAERWVSSRVLGEPGVFWGRRVGDRQPGSTRGAPGCGCAAGTAFPTGSRFFSPVRARLWQTPVVPAVSTGWWDNLGRRGRREDGQPPMQPGHPPHQSRDTEQKWFCH